MKVWTYQQPTLESSLRHAAPDDSLSSEWAVCFGERLMGARPKS